MFATKAELIKSLLEDPEWSQKLEKAKTTKEIIKILEAYAKQKGYKTTKIKQKEETK